MSFIVKNTTFFNPLDLLAPHSCRGCGRMGVVICDCCKKYIISSERDICPACKSKLVDHKCLKCSGLPPIFYLGERKNLLATLIHDFKYNSVRTIGTKFVEILDETLPKTFPKNSVLVPLPTSTKHIRARGFDHMLFMAKRLAKVRGIPLENVLIRAKNTVQVGTDEETRKTQAASAYALNPKIKISPEKTYILFDDVWTTGSSMEAAIKKLREAGAKNLIILLLAVNRLS